MNCAKIIVSFIGAAGMGLAQTTFTLDQAVYAPGQDIVSSWTGGPGSATDWVGIYPRGTVPDGDPGSTIWLYVNGTRTATSGLVDGSLTFASPGLPAGEWSAHFLANNGYTPIATKVDFEVADVTIIQSFGPDHQFIDEGLPITLNWSVTGVDPPVTSLTLDDGSGSLNVLGQSSIEVSPASNREYTLELNNAQRAVAKIFKDAGITAAFSLNKVDLQSGESLTATWTGATANPDSWVGLYRAGDTPAIESSTAWNYLNGSQTAGGNVPDGEMNFNLADGSYYACLFLDNGHIIEQGPIRFTVGDGSPAPRFVIDPIRRIHALTGQPYSGKLGAYVRSGVSGGVTFSKKAGPDWLTIASDGSLSGTPGPDDVGGNQFAIEVSDVAAATASATLKIEVFTPGTIHLPRLKALTFNVWVGTGNVSDGYNKGLDSILISDADIVAVSENNGRAAQWANDLGWAVYQSGSDNAVLSRYPVVDTFTANHSVGARLRISDSPLREVNFWACHFTAYPYGPYDARDASGGDAAKVAAALASERNSGRVAQVNSFFFAASSQLAAADTAPVLLLGDFNCPSHLDWTPATAAAGQHFGLVIDWPVTRATARAGMLDAYRVRHPDPVAMPGTTWTPIDPNDVQDRIDMVQFKGAPLSVVDCRVFTTIAQGRWPSDHAGVLAEFSVAPVDSDSDGLSDAWEVAKFGNISSQGASGNPDGDRLNNFGEQGFGTNPNAPNDPTLLEVRSEMGEFRIAYRRLPGGAANGSSYTSHAIRYLIELSNDLETWAPASERAVPIGSPLEIANGIEEALYRLDPPSGGETPDRQFVRVRLESVGP
ncbi:MAG: endonuclease/exonuclease/phosphatase family protein [Roseibacillus sp.]